MCIYLYIHSLSARDKFLFRGQTSASKCIRNHTVKSNCITPEREYEDFSAFNGNFIFSYCFWSVSVCGFMRYVMQRSLLRHCRNTVSSDTTLARIIITHIFNLHPN